MNKGLNFFRDMIQQNTLSALQQDAYNSIINDLFINNTSSVQKYKNLHKIIPGCIYCFIYKAINPTTYIIDNQKF